MEWHNQIIDDGITKPQLVWDITQVSDLDFEVEFIV